MSNIKMVKQWVAEDGSTHDTRQAAEENAMRIKAMEIMRSTDNPATAINQLIACGILSFKVKQQRKPRAKPTVSAAAIPADAKKANGAKKVAA